MREILFRGKTYNNEWVEGLLVWIFRNNKTAVRHCKDCANDIVKG